MVSLYAHMAWEQPVYQGKKLHKPQKLLKPPKPKKSHSAAIESMLEGQDFYGLLIWTYITYMVS